MAVDPVSLTVIIKGVGMALLIIGGIAALWFGYRLYQSGVGAGKDSIGLQFGKLKASGRSVGSVVMATAFAWGGLGYMISPNFEKRGDEVRVYSFELPGGTVTASALSMKVPRPVGSATELGGIVKLFGSAVVVAEKSDQRPIVQLNGRPAEIDVASAKAVKNPQGQTAVLANVRAGQESATVLFETLVKDRQLVFQPSAASIKAIKPDLYKAVPHQKEELGTGR